MKYTEEEKCVKWYVGLTPVSVLSLAPTVGLGPRKMHFTEFLLPAVGQYHPGVRWFPSIQGFRLVSEGWKSLFD